MSTVPVSTRDGAASAFRLITLLAGETPQRKQRPNQYIPDVSALPTAEQVRDLITDATDPARPEPDEARAC
jgi:hypothetical protein